MDIKKLSNIPSGWTENIHISNDNGTLLSPCDFKDNSNFFNNTQCIETMTNLGEPEDMTNFEKGYLIAFTILVVGLLFKANTRL